MVRKPTNEELADRVRAGDDSAFEPLWSGVQAFIWQIVRRLARQFAIDEDRVEDLVQEGRLIVWQRAKLFEIERGLKFMTYLYRPVVQRLRKLAAEGGVIRTPANQEAASDRTREAKTFARTVLSLDAQDDRELPPLRETLVAADQGTRLYDDDMIATALAIGELLEERDRTILLSRARGLKLREVGDSLGITKERVRQLEMRAIAIVREAYGIEKCDHAKCNHARRKSLGKDRKGDNHYRCRDCGKAWTVPRAKVRGRPARDKVAAVV